MTLAVMTDREVTMTSADRSFVIPAPDQASVAVDGSQQRFAVRRIYCVGRNYAAHVEEMGGTTDRDPPLFFAKPSDAVVDSGSTTPYPPQTADFHYEIELVLAIGKGGRNIPEASALDHVWGYGVGLDMTRRDLQGAKSWEVAKGFDHSCPCGPITPADRVGDIQEGRIHLEVNGETRQDSDIGLLIWKLPEIISRLSQLFELKPGDIILTGTPHGIGPVVPGDKLVGTIDKLQPLEVTIGPKA